MKKLLLFLSIIIACSTASFAEGHHLPIQFDPPTTNDDTADRPKMPAYSPVRACVYDNEIVIYSISEGIGEISVTNAYGITIASETAELSEGISIELPDDTDGITVTVVFNNRTYSASL